MNLKSDRSYTEAQIVKGLRLWFQQKDPRKFQANNAPDRYDYIPGIVEAIRIENEASTRVAVDVDQMDLPFVEEQ
jgi:hypothetical protein